MGRRCGLGVVGRASVVVFSCAACLQPSVARADEAKPPSLATASREQILERAKQHQQAGVDAFRAGKYQAAIDAFLDADRLVPSPALSFNVGRAYDR